VKIRGMLLLNLLLLVLTFTLIAGFQTTFWFQLFGSVPAPLLWLNMVVFIALYRRPYPAIFMIYGFGFLMMSFSAVPLAILWATLLVLFILLYSIKTRFYWGGSVYYAIMCSFAAVAFHIIYPSLSAIFETNTVAPDLLDRAVQIILTPSFAFPMYWILNKIDSVSRDESLHEVGGLEL